MAQNSELAESYRDLSKILATIASGLLVAAGIGATFFSSSVSSALTLTNQGYDMALRNSTALAQTNTTELIQEGAFQSLQAANGSVQLMFFIFSQGILVSCFSIYFWYNSHKVLKGEKTDLSLRKPALGFLIGMMLLSSFTITI